jgi:hypothetical protein
MAETAKQKISLLGIVVTILVTAGFVWSGWQWFNRYNYPRALGAEEIKANEIKTFNNLKLIARAQLQYIQKDWDGDGKKTYAQFFIHLWSTVNAEHDPVRAGFIPKELGFAMGPSSAVNGYYFLDLRSRTKTGSNETVPLNYANEWAIAAVPALVGKTGHLTFLADSSGRIFAKKIETVPTEYPHDPAAEAWIQIKSPADL